MPLPLPVLDRLTYDELVSEARSSLPALAPGWTDYNAHDPGITLIELLAWLAEGASYRLDTIPDESYRAFLRLAGVVQRPPQVAETMLVFQPETPAAAVPVSDGMRVQSNSGDVVFQTTSNLFVSSATLNAVVCGAGATCEDLTVSNTKMAATFLPFGAKPQQGDALYLGFDEVLAPKDSIVSLGVWTGNELVDHATRSRLAAEQNAVEGEAARLCPEGLPPHWPDWRQHYGACTVWEYYAAPGQWQPLQDIVDTTRALTLSGTVRFTAPGDQKEGGVALPNHGDTYFIRCRLERGAFDCPPRIAHIAMNAIVARHAVDVSAQTFRSTGRAAQSFELAPIPVVPDSTTITVTSNGTADGVWHAAPAWDGVGAHDRSCILDTKTGTLNFGDGRIGRVPPVGSEIRVEYQTGGGIAGNVVAGTLVQPVSAQPDLKVRQPFAACGGEESESLNQAKARAVRELASPTRAVTLSDFELLALETPGVPLARVHAIPEYHPAMPCIGVAGSTTVVVLPPCPPARPEPTPALIATVQRYLARRRLLASEIHVIGPHYTTVSVSARLYARKDTDRQALIRQARSALDTFFHPLQGGSEGTGWPIGRAVYRSELLTLLNNLEGVQYVEELLWSIDGQPASRCGNVTICRHGLVASGTHEIAINEGSSCHE